MTAHSYVRTYGRPSFTNRGTDTRPDCGQRALWETHHFSNSVPEQQPHREANVRPNAGSGYHPFPVRRDVCGHGRGRLCGL